MAPFKSTQSFSVGHFLKSFRNRDAVGPAALNSPVRTDRRPGIEATGGDGTATPGNGYKYHFFTAPGVFTITSGGGNVDVLLVGGGGAGTSQDGSYAGGGGGAGGFVEREFDINPGTYPISIGSGGNLDLPGGNTTAFSYVAAGGGKGGRNVPSVDPQNYTADPGGSGGGGGGGEAWKAVNGTPVAVVGNDPPLTPPQGNPGGDGSPGGGGGGGGGGAGQPGFDFVPGGPLWGGGHGGAGRVAFNGDTGIPPSYGTPGDSPGRWFAGGGGAGTWNSSYGVTESRQGGTGGGGRGAFDGNNGTQGVDGTGGGGGGSAQQSNGYPGGDGIVIVRYTV